MKKKEKLISLSAILMAAFLSVSFTACGEKDLEFRNEGPIEIIDDDGIPSGSAGDESMFGYYSRRTGWNTNMNTLLSWVEAGSTWPGDFDQVADVWETTGFDTGYRIVDGHTIYQVKEGATLKYVADVAKNYIDLVEIDTKTITFERPYYINPYPAGTYSYTYRNFMESEPRRWWGEDLWEGRYSINGSTMTVNTDEGYDGKTYTWTYSNGSITITDSNGQTEIYVKVK